MSELDRRFWKYHDLPEPATAHMTLDVALYPEERRAVTAGDYGPRTLTPQPIPDIHVREATLSRGVAHRRNDLPEPLRDA